MTMIEIVLIMLFAMMVIPTTICICLAVVNDFMPSRERREIEKEEKERRKL